LFSFAAAPAAILLGRAMGLTPRGRVKGQG
jgi:hypothetical protein